MRNQNHALSQQSVSRPTLPRRTGRPRKNVPAQNAAGETSEPKKPGRPKNTEPVPPKGKRIVDRLYAILEEKDIPASRLCDDLGFSKSYLAGVWRSEKGMIPAEKLKMIAAYLKCDFNYLLTGKSLADERKELEDQYYSEDRTLSTAQRILDDRNLALLFDAAQDADEKDLLFVTNMLLAYKKEELGMNDTLETP